MNGNMLFLPGLQVGPGTTHADFLTRAHGLGVKILQGEPDPATGVYAVRCSGVQLDGDLVDGVVVHIAGTHVVRAIAHTRAGNWGARFGTPSQASDGHTLWVWPAPRRSVESRPLTNGWRLEAKFFDDAIQAGILSESYVRSLYATI